MLVDSENIRACKDRLPHPLPVWYASKDQVPPVQDTVRAGEHRLSHSLHHMLQQFKQQLLLLCFDICL